MKLLIVAVGQRVPDWAQTAYDDYAKRFPPELKVELRAVKTEPRGSRTTGDADGSRARAHRGGASARLSRVVVRWTSAARRSPPRRWRGSSPSGSWGATTWRW